MLDRRRLLALAGSALFPGRSALGRSPAPASVTIDYEDPGRAIAGDFMGLSYESALLAAPDYFSRDNHALLRLIRALGRRGVLRIGGNTSERTVWRPEGGEISGRYVITPAAIDRFAAFVRELDWQVIYGLNLADNAAARAADEAAYVARALGPLLVAFQIGNEPDGFPRWSGVRPAGYGVREFMTEWQEFHRAILARVPEARFAGPDVAAETGWVATFAQSKPENLVLLTRHYYAAGPATDPAVTLPKLLGSAERIEPVLRELETVGRGYRLPYRIAETNSVYAGGRSGVSDTMGAALWGTELMFQIAAGGGSGINFHAGPDKVYTPIRGGPPHGAQPLYYGMLLFAQAAHGVLVPSALRSPRELAGFAARGDDGTLRICLINKGAEDARVRVDPGRPFAAAAAIRLAAPGIDASTGLALGGAAVDQAGGWAPAWEMLDFESGHLLADLPAASAVLLRLQPR